MVPKLLILAFLVGIVFTQDAHAQGKELPVEVIVDKLSHKNIRAFLEKEIDAVFKFYHDEFLPDNNITNKCIVLKSTDKEKSINTVDDIAISSLKNLKQFKVNSSKGVIQLKMESFKNDKGDICEYDRSDNYHSIVALEVKLHELNPGVFSAQLPIMAKDDKFAASIRVRYGIPAPAPITAEAIQKVNDPLKSITLKSMMELSNKANLSYVWEYKMDTENDWKELGKTPTESFVLLPAKDIFKKAIKTNETIHFRMKAISSEIAGPYTENFTVLFTPPAPHFEKSEVKTVPTCPNSPSGSISIANITVFSDSLGYYILKGKTIDSSAYPDVVAQDVKAYSGTTLNNKPLSVQKLDEGDYTIVLYNANALVGKMFTTHVFSIKKMPLLSIKSDKVSDATCSNSADGQILIELEGGNPGKLVTSITPNVGRTKQVSRSIYFTELPVGIYTVFVKDECSQIIASKELEVLQKTVQIRGLLEIESEPMDNTTNGVVKVSMEGGTGQYKYIVTKGIIAGAEKTETTNIFKIDKFAKGTFKLKVVDANFPSCPSWDTTFSIIGKTQETIAVDTIKAPEPEKKDTIKNQTSKIIEKNMIFKSSRVTSFQNTIPMIAAGYFIKPDRFIFRKFAKYQLDVNRLISFEV